MTTKKFQIAKALAAQEYFSIVSPNIVTPKSEKTDQKLTRKIYKKRTRKSHKLS